MVASGSFTAVVRTGLCRFNMPIARAETLAVLALLSTVSQSGWGHGAHPSFRRTDPLTY